MKATSLFSLGACGGALAAFLFFAVDSARSVLSSAELSSDATIQDLVGSEAGLDSVERRAEDSPDAALRDVLVLESDVIRTNAVAGVARVFARRDPEAALAAADGLPVGSRPSYVSAVVSEWAFVDPAGFFAYAEAASSIDDLIAGLEVLIATDPARVFEIAARFRGPAAPEIDALYLHAVRGMAGRDPVGTIARLQGVATGAQRDPILTSIAEAYAAIDANAALDWAMSVMPPSQDALGTVIETVAGEDLLRAFEMLQLAPADLVNTRSHGAALVAAALRARQSPGVLAGAFATRTGPEAAAMLTLLMQQWAGREPEGAVAWMAGNEAWLTDDLTRAMVASLAFEDVSLAAELSGRVPSAVRGPWLDAVANRYGQFDVEAGMAWLAGHEGSEGYDALLNSLLRGASVTSPQFVAEYIETSDRYFDESFIRQTAFRFAQQSPEAAAEWAVQIDDPDYSDWALESTIDRWSQTDGPAAQRWVMNQPPGAARDRLLGTILLSSAINPTIDAGTIVRAYDSESSAQQALSQYIFRSTRVPDSMLNDSLARAEAALELLTDPGFRAQAEAQIAEARGN